MLAGRNLLSPMQRLFLTAFAELPDQDHFYLTGGTALAEFYLGHRLSFDLDLFTAEAALILPMSYQVETSDSLGGMHVSVVRRFATYVEFLLTSDEDTLRVGLALDSPFRLAPLEYSTYGIWVNSFQDLKVDKLLAYYGRAEPRDAVDLYFILQLEPLDLLLTLAAQKDPGFDLYWFAVALERATGFPDELDRWPANLLKPVDPVELKQTFHKLAMELMSRTL